MKRLLSAILMVLLLVQALPLKALASAGHVLTEEEREQLNASALQFYQNERLLELCARWKDDYEIETHPELLEY